MKIKAFRQEREFKIIKINEKLKQNETNNN